MGNAVNLRRRQQPGKNIESLESRRMLADDHGGDIFDATPIEFPTTIVGTFETAEDEDWFQFLLPGKAGPIRVTPNLPDSIPFSISQPKPQYVETIPNDCADDCSFQWQAFGGPSEFVGVRSNGTTGQYSFTLERADNAGSEPETAGDGAAFTSASKWIYPQDDVDVWRYVVPADRFVSWSIAGKGMHTVRLVDRDGLPLNISRQTTWGQTVTFQSSMETEAFVEVSNSELPSESNDFGQYSIDNRIYDSFPYNVTPAVFGNTRSNSVVSFRLNHASEAWLRFPVRSTTERYTVDLRRDNPNIDFFEGNEEIASIQNANHKVQGDTVSNIGSEYLYIRVSSNIVTRRSVELVVEFDEHGDSIEDATRLELTDGVASGHGRISSLNDVDVFVLHAEKGKVYEISSKHVITVESADGTAVRLHDRWHAPETTDLYFTIRTSRTRFSYDFEVLATSDDAPDAKQDATVINVPMEITLTRESPRDSDWFAIQTDEEKYYRTEQSCLVCGIGGLFSVIAAAERGTGIQYVERPDVEVGESVSFRIFEVPAPDDSVPSDRQMLRLGEIVHYPDETAWFEFPVVEGHVYQFLGTGYVQLFRQVNDEFVELGNIRTHADWSATATERVVIRSNTRLGGSIAIVQATTPDTAREVAIPSVVSIDAQYEWNATWLKFTHTPSEETRYLLTHVPEVGNRRIYRTTPDGLRPVDAVITLPGEYYIRLWSENSDPFDVRFELRSNPHDNNPQPKYDEPNTRETAQLVQPGEQLRVNLVSNRHRYWYAINVVAGYSYSFRQFNQSQFSLETNSFLQGELAVDSGRIYFYLNGTSNGKVVQYLDDYPDLFTDQFPRVPLEFTGSIDSTEDTDQFLVDMPVGSVFRLETTTADEQSISVLPRYGAERTENDSYISTQNSIRMRARGDEGTYRTKITIDENITLGNRSQESATHLPVGNTQLAFVADDAPAAWFYLDVQAGVQYVVEWSDAEPKLRRNGVPYFGVFAGEGERQVTIFAQQQKNQFVFSPHVSERMWIRTGFAGRAAVHSLTVDELPNQHGNSPETATAIEVPSVQHGDFYFNRNETDYFALDMVKDATYQFDVIADQFHNLQIFDSDGQRLNRRRAGSFQWSAPTAGRYFLNVLGGSSHFSHYSLFVSEVGDTEKPASPESVIDIGIPQHGTPETVALPSLANAGDTQWLRLTSQGSESIRVLPQDSLPYWDIDLFLGDDLTPTAGNTVYVGQPTDVYLRVFSRTTHVDSENLSFVIESVHDALPNSEATAKHLSLPINITGFGGAFESDWIAYDTVAGEYYRVTVNDSTHLFRAEETKTLAVAVEQSRGGYTYSVEQIVDESTSAEDAVLVESVVNGFITSSDDVDWLRLELEEGQLVRFYLPHDAFFLDSRSTIQLRSTENNLFRVPALETFYVVLTGRGIREYSFSIQSNPDILLEELTVANPKIMVDDAIFRVGEPDTFLLPVKAGQAYQVVRPTGYTTFQLHDSSGEIVSYNGRDALLRDSFRWIAQEDDVVRISVNNPLRRAPEYQLQIGTLFGDANLDGAFNSTDFVTVFSAGEYEDDIVGNSTWSEGDWNGDGDFDSGDLVAAFSAGSYESSTRDAAARLMRIAPSDADVAMMLFREDDEPIDRPLRPSMK
ncbi:dockerin type I repeat-containing protein [Planctomycetota bacterium]